MKPERWQRIEGIYHAALERAADERAAYLAEACADDEPLRREVEALLAANAQVGSFLAGHALTLEAKQSASAQTASPASPVGQRINRYEVLAQIGAGGMGEVYLARDTVLERQVALKLLPAQFTRDTGRLQRFVREAKAVSALNHPNIITIHEIGEATTGAGGTHFIVTEFIEGVTLRQRLTAGRMKLHEALAVARQMAAALEAAHKTGIIHRDIKPENVMVRPDGLVKVLDFGLAHMTEQPARAVDSQAPTQAHAITESGVVMGTPRYMSPEQARGQKVDARTDVFSLGVTLYEMVAGAPPFTGATAAEVFAALLGQEPKPLSECVPEAPDELAACISRALEKDREARYATISEFTLELEQLKHQLEVETEDAPTRQFRAQSGARTKAPLKERTGEAAQRKTADALAQEQTGWPRRRAVFSLAALALLAAAGFGLYKLAVEPRPSSGPFNSVTFTSAQGTKNFPCFSPDGSQITYSWDGAKKELNGMRDIYVQVVGSSYPLRLTTAPEDEVYPAWSPDTRYIAFLRHYGGTRYELFIVPPLGGPERKLADVSSGVSWSPDGKMLAVSSAVTKDDPGSIYLISAETGEKLRRLTTASVMPPFNDLRPAFSPDGKYVAFVRNGSALDLCVVPVTGGTPKRLTSGSIGVLTWTGDSREVVYANGRKLMRIPATGGEPVRIQVTGQNPQSPAISRQGNRLAYNNEFTDSNIYLYEGPGFAGNAVPGKFGEPARLLASTLEDTSPQFSPDGTKIVYVSYRDNEDLWLSDGDGRNQIQLTNLQAPTGSPHWSPDGRWIVFDSRKQGNADIYVISATGGQARAVTTETSADSKPSWSSDGRSIYFNSNRSGKEEIWQVPAAGGQTVQITHGGAFEGFESPDGKLFYFTKARHTYGIWSVPVGGGDEKLVPELSQAGYWRSWGVVKEGLYFITKEPAKQQTIRFFNFATRRVTPLLTVEKEPLGWQPGLSLSTDGRRLLYAQLDYIVNDILLIENFR